MNSRKLLLLSVYLTLLMFNNTISHSESELNTDLPYLEITSDDQFAALAEQYEWQGDGTENDPYRIEYYALDHGESSDLAEAVKSAILYTDGGFDLFDLIISQVSYHVVIQHNIFMYSVLVNQSLNVEVRDNEWQNDIYPSNLFIVSDHPTVRDNFFTGSNELCDTGNEKYTPRVFILGSGAQILHNHFDIDRGCHPIQQLILYPTPTHDVRLIATTAIADNWFEASDLSIQSTYGNLVVTNNDIEYGDFGIFVQTHAIGVHAKFSENNFIQSNVGQIGNQFYENGQYIISPYWGGWSEGSPSIDMNYYSALESEDVNDDGYYDQPQSFASIDTPDSISDVYIYDYHPSTTPYPGYHGKAPESPLKPWMVAVAGITIASLGGIWWSYRLYSKPKPIFEGDLTGNQHQIIKEIFKSQTIVYYTLIGQSRVSDKEIEEKLKESIPKDIFDYKYLLHPIRLTFTKLLYENLELTSIEIRDILEISWNEYFTHLKALKKHKMLHVEERFIDGQKRQVLSLNQNGIEEYKTLADLLHLILDSSSYTGYVNAAQKRLNRTDSDTYPEV